MNFNQLETKGDYIDYCLSNCPYIRSIDPAIPLDVQLACKGVNTPTSSLVTIYYDTGEVCYENIIAKACITNRTNQLKEQLC